MAEAIAESGADRAERALARARDRLLALQDARGFWKAELQTNVTMEAEDLMLRRFLGLEDAEKTRLTANWIRSQQGPDGGWSVCWGADSDLSCTIESYVALRLAGDPTDAEHMRRARERVLAGGGIERARVFTRMWLALFGQWSWRDLPALPPELILLPSWFPLNVYDFASWARQTIVPLTIVAAHRPRRSLGFEVRELRTGRFEPERFPITTFRGAFQWLDRALHLYERFPLPRLRRQAIRLGAEWILRRQEADGCWGGIQPPWVYSLMALELMGYPKDHPAFAKGFQALDDYAIVEGDVRRIEACQSPVWDTALAMVALEDAGLPAQHPALARGADWLLSQEIRVPGDWSVKRPRLAPSGFAFEFENDNYPDIDDTAEVVMALRGARVDAPERVVGAAERSVAWTFGMQCGDGGWGAFDVDNTRTVTRELPFCDFGEVIDPPSADVTAHVLEMLAREGLADDPRSQRGLAWLLRAQEPDGSWFGRWGVNHVYGTGAAVPALVEMGVSPQHPAVRRAVAWLEGVQNADGGWGEDERSYRDPAWRGRGPSMPSQTAWALLALLAADGRSDAIERGIDWLVANQRDDGNWDEPAFTGTGFPSDFYINYHLYRLNFPVMALGRYLRRRT